MAQDAILAPTTDVTSLPYWSVSPFGREECFSQMTQIHRDQTSPPAGPFVVAFVGYAEPTMTGHAAAYEDEVLPLLEDHGARVLYRGRRADHEDPSLPVEVHLLWFPDRQALTSYLADGRRLAAMQRAGEVFTLKQVVEMETISGTAVTEQ